MISLKVLPFILLASVATAQVLSVQHGGTGQTTLTQHGPLVGNGTGAVTAISPGTAGQCLISGGPSVDPVFAPCPGGVGGGPGAGSCSVNQYVNALINGSPPTCSQITYSQLGGTVPTWNQSTTGNAATATALSTPGTANQVWGMNAGGTAQGWQTPSGVSGSTAVSALTGATGSNTIPNAGYPQQWTWNLGSGSATGMWFNESAAATGSSTLMEISTVPNSTATPLVVYAGNNGFFNFAANGELQARGAGAKFAGPVLLTNPGNPGTPVASAAALGTDPNGNIIPVAGGGGGAGAPLYHRAFPAITVNLPNGQVYNLSAWGPECLVVGWCVMVAPSEDATYSFGFEMVVTANGSNCTALTLGVHLAFTPADPPSAVQIVTTMAVRNLNASSVLLTAANLSGAPLNTLYGDIQGVPVEFRAKAGTNVSFRLLQGTYTCDVPPVITFRPVLRGPLGY